MEKRAVSKLENEAEKPNNKRRIKRLKPKDAPFKSAEIPGTPPSRDVRGHRETSGLILWA